MLAAVKKLCPARQAGREHVVDPDAEADERGRDHRQDDDRIAERPAPREGRDDRATKPGRGQEDDVDLGVAEEPEQVLPQQRVAALGRVVEVRPDQAVGQQHADASATAGIAKITMNDTTSCPDEQRHPVERHARRAQLEDGADEARRDGQPRDLGERDHLRPDVGPLAGAVLRPGERQ